MTRPAKNYHCYSCSRGTSLSYKGKEMSTRKRKYPALRKKYKASATYQAHENLLRHSVTCILQNLLRHQPKWSKTRYLKAETLQVPQKVRIVLV